MVIQGFTEEYLLHYTDTYCPTPFKESFRLLIYYHVTYGWHTYVFDVKYAFLNAKIDTETIYIEVPQYFPEYIDGLVQYMQLLKALYGTKQAAMLWHKFIIKILIELGYVREDSDQCAFNYFDSTGTVVSKCIIHIDDMPIVAKDPQEFQRIANYLKQNANLEITESSVWNKILGVNFGHDIHDNMVVYNDIFISSLIASLKLDNIPEYDLPHSPNVYYVPNEGSLASPALHKRYRTILGSLLWISLQWRMDIDFIVNHLSRFLANPSIEHYNASLRVLGYLKRTRRDGMVYRKPLTPIDTKYSPQILIHTDANWSGDRDCKSISSTVVSVHTLPEITAGMNTSQFPTGNALAWSSRRQQSYVADSSEAAETYCMVDAVKLNAWLRDKLEFSYAKQVNPTLILNDNKAAPKILEQQQKARIEIAARQIIESFPGISWKDLSIRLNVEQEVLPRLLDKNTKKFVFSEGRENNNKSEFSDDDILEGLRLAEAFESPINRILYDSLVSRGLIHGPGSQTVMHRFGTWNKACQLANVSYNESVRASYESLWGKEEVLDYLIEFLKNRTYGEGVQSYDEWRIETLSSAPSGAHVRNIFDTWINAKNSALKKMFDKNISPDLV
jgi:hypothetical protein